MAQFEFKYGKKRYTAKGLESLSEKELRAEYSRMRAVANKRINRLKNSEFSEEQIARQYRKGFPTLANISTRTELEHQFVEVAYVLRQKRSTVSGAREIRAKSLETYQEQGLEFVNERNVDLFNHFWAYVKDHYDDTMYDSEQVAAWFDENSHFKNGNDKALSTIEKHFRVYIKEEFGADYSR